MSSSSEVNPRATRHNQISGFANGLLNGLFILTIILCISPILLVVLVSITDESSLNAKGYSFIPDSFSFKAYDYVFGNATQILHSYGVTLFVTIVGSLLGVLITALYAYPLSRKDFRFKSFFAFVVFFTMLFNGGMVPTFMVYTHMMHWQDSIWILIFPLLMSPMFVLMMRTFFVSGIPDSILESAKIDGAGEFRIFFSIVLRLSTPALATIGLFYTLLYWNDWFTALLYVNGDKLVPLQLLLYRVQASIDYIMQISSQTGQGAVTISELPGQSVRMALCVIAIGPIMFAYPFFQKYFVTGLTIGAIKG